MDVFAVLKAVLLVALNFVLLLQQELYIFTECRIFLILA